MQKSCICRRGERENFLKLSSSLKAPKKGTDLELQQREMKNMVFGVRDDVKTHFQVGWKVLLGEEKVETGLTT